MKSLREAVVSVSLVLAGLGSLYLGFPKVGVLCFVLATVVSGFVNVEV